MTEITGLDDNLKALLATASATHGRMPAVHAAAIFDDLEIYAAADLAKFMPGDFARMPGCGTKTVKLIEEIARLAEVELLVSRPASDPAPLGRSYWARTRDQAIVRLGKAYRSQSAIMLTVHEVQALGSVLEPLLEDFEQVK